MIYQSDPLVDPRWKAFVANHNSASIFHTVEWLRAIHDTYGYVPSVLTTSGPTDDLRNALVFCRVDSWLTGKRFVSLPFSDHCEPLTEAGCALAEIFDRLEAGACDQRCKYVELRPVALAINSRPGWHVSESFYLHRLNLRGNASDIFTGFHKSCVQRRITRAIKESVEIGSGRGSKILNDFYSLLIETRRRHGLLPQPKAWFANVLKHLNDNAVIRCAYKQGRPIAAILTLRFRKTLYYKYGASDKRFHRSGAMPYLLWAAIDDAVKQGFDQLDMGRTDHGNEQLAVFKDRWNATRSSLSYWRTPIRAGVPLVSRLPRSFTSTVFGHLPTTCFTALGDLCYRHAG